MSAFPDPPNVPPIKDPSLFQFLQGLRHSVWLLAQRAIAFSSETSAAVRAAILEGERQIAEFRALFDAANQEIDDAIAGLSDDVADLQVNYTTLNSTVLGHTASLTTQGSTLITLTGQVYSRYMITANTDGRVTGMTLLSASGPTNLSAVVFKADTFMIESSSSTAVQPFYYNAVTGTLYTDTITVRNANIENLSVGTTKIANNAVTAQASSRNAGLVTVPAGATDWGIIISGITTTTSAAVVHISFSAYLNPQVQSSGGVATPTQKTLVEIALQRNGVTLFSDTVGVAALTAAGEYLMSGGRFPITWSDTPGAGSHTYLVTATIDGSAHDGEFTGLSLNLVRFEK